LVPPGLAYIADNIVRRNNILGADAGQRSRWASPLHLPHRSDVLFFAGCGYQFAPQLEVLTATLKKMDMSFVGADFAMRLARLQDRIGLNLTALSGRIFGHGSSAGPLEAAVRVLRRLGVAPGYLHEEEPCCGAPLYHSGYETRFAENARRAYEALRASGAREVIGLVPSCTYALKNLFPVYIEGYDLRVRHFLEVVVEKIAPYRLRFPRQVRVAYHDPCQLVRYFNFVDEPRRILKAVEGIELVEPSWTKGEWASCCGGGGGFEAVFPELSQIIGVNRVRELLEGKPDIIVTHCPGCILQLKAGLRELKMENVAVLDLAEVIAMAME
ncbi:MAG: (Fe-S)-binding protein, partial [Dehalococcoidales bacterium]|nr:(Fe-S)-binding protein [Dehalococcoidales bacterium]